MKFSESIGRLAGRLPPPSKHASFILRRLLEVRMTCWMHPRTHVLGGGERTLIRYWRSRSPDHGRPSPGARRRLDRDMVSTEAQPLRQHRPQDADVLVGNGHHGLLPGDALTQLKRPLREAVLPPMRRHHADFALGPSHETAAENCSQTVLRSAL